MPDMIRTYYEQLPTLAQDLASRGSLALMLIDVSPFASIEEEYGTDTYSLVRQRMSQQLMEQAGKEFRKEDILLLDHPEGLRFLLFLSPQRHSTLYSYKDLEAVRIRMMGSLIPSLIRTSFPYLKRPPQIDIGFGMGIHNPLLDSHHVVLRAIQEATSRAKWQQMTDQMDSLQALREAVLNEHVTTLYQPIVSMGNGEIFGYEALSRGAAKCPFSSADQLFDAAIQHHLLVELDRVCRKRALACFRRFPSGVKIFVNTLPATMRDPEFRGQHLIKSLEEAGITPERIVIEITEKLVIDNLSLFQESMNYFTDLGMSLAVDDVGAGYSGLETIGKLKPKYLKLDASLIHDIHTSVANVEMLKAILLLGRGIGAKIVAEGIEQVSELNLLRKIGVDYGQGFFLGRPGLPPQAAAS